MTSQMSIGGGRLPVHWGKFGFFGGGTDNLASWMVARNDGEHYGRLVLYRFPKQSLVYGPAQIVNQINQDTTSRARSRCGTRADPERLRLSLQLAPDFVLDGLWQRFRVPTLGDVDRHTLRVQHVAMIVLRGLVFGHRSGPGNELVADHLLGQLLRRAAVRQDDPAALLSPWLLPPGHPSLPDLS